MTLLPDPNALAGATGEVTRTVGAADTAVAVGSGDLAVLGTPILIALMEAAACAALDAHLTPDATSVGTHVDVRHLAPSPLGARVVARATVIDVRRATVTFEVTASHELHGGTTVIGAGRHDRVIVDRHTFGRSQPSA